MRTKYRSIRTNLEVNARIEIANAQKKESKTQNGKVYAPKKKSNAINKNKFCTNPCKSGFGRALYIVGRNSMRPNTLVVSKANS